MISLLASALLCWDPSPGAPAAPLRPNLNVEDRPRYFVRRLEPLPTPTFSDIADKLFGVTTVIDLGDAPSHAPAAHGRASFDAPSIQGRASTDAPTSATLGSPSVTVDIPSSADTLRGHPLRTPSADTLGVPRHPRLSRPQVPQPPLSRLQAPPRLSLPRAPPAP